MKKAVLSTLLAVIAFVSACNKPDEPTVSDPANGSFDKSAMLSAYADNLIIPAYQSLNQKFAQLQTATDAFVQTPDATTQNNLRSAYKAAYSQYEHAAAFQFGPAESALLDLFLNFSGGLDYSFTTAGELTGFSVDSVTIEQRSAGASYDLTSVTRSSFYSQGFGAFGYLCFAPDAVTKLQGNALRGQYIKVLANRMTALASQVSNDWTNYRSAFISNTKTNVGSPIGNIVNQLAYQLDVSKGPRIGWPYGKQSNGIVFANKCEAFYAGFSKELAVENLRGLKQLYQGSASGKGLSDYVVSLKQTQLNEDLLNQFDLAISKVEAIPAPLPVAFTSNKAEVDAAYREIQKLLTLIKTDLASATAVQINFMDNDGD